MAISNQYADGTPTENAQIDRLHEKMQALRAQVATIYIQTSAHLQGPNFLDIEASYDLIRNIKEIAEKVVLGERGL